MSCILERNLTVSEREERERGSKNIFEGIIAKNLLKLLKNRVNLSIPEDK